MVVNLFGCIVNFAVWSTTLVWVWVLNFGLLGCFWVLLLLDYWVYCVYDWLLYYLCGLVGCDAAAALFWVWGVELSALPTLVYCVYLGNTVGFDFRRFVFVLFIVVGDGLFVMVCIVLVNAPDCFVSVLMYLCF